MGRALLIANGTDADPGVIGRLANDAGYGFEVLRREEPGRWPSLDGAELVVALGSDWSVYWDQVQAEVASEVAVLREAHGRGLSILGICFGAQIVAHALGGSVRRASRPEIGWYEIDTDAPDIVERGPWFEWHVDTFTPPPDAVVHARSAVGPQAFTLGRTRAVQFHPEIDVPILRRWVAGGKSELEAAGVCADELVEATGHHAEANARRAGALFESFCAEVVGR